MKIKAPIMNFEKTPEEILSLAEKHYEEILPDSAGEVRLGPRTITRFPIGDLRFFKRQHCGILWEYIILNPKHPEWSKRYLQIYAKDVSALQNMTRLIVGLAQKRKAEEKKIMVKVHPKFWEYKNDEDFQKKRESPVGRQWRRLQNKWDEKKSELLNRIDSMHVLIGRRIEETMFYTFEVGAQRGVQAAYSEFLKALHSLLGIRPLDARGGFRPGAGAHKFPTKKKQQLDKFRTNCWNAAKKVKREGDAHLVAEIANEFGCDPTELGFFYKKSLSRLITPSGWADQQRSKLAKKK